MEVILVDRRDNEIGKEEKIKAHELGKLHRAFSIFIFNNKKQLILQKRSDNKYHSAGLWSNTCCSHPRPNKLLKEEAKKRLQEEMGFSTELKEIFSFIYKAPVNGLIEHEFDHVFIGQYDKDPNPNELEVSDWKWISLKDLEKDIRENPDNYTIWLKLSLRKVQDFLDNM